MDAFFIRMRIEISSRVDTAHIPFQSQKIIVAQPLRDVIELQRNVVCIVGGGVSVE